MYAPPVEIRPEIVKSAKEAILTTIPPETIQHFDRWVRGVVIEQIKANGGTSSPELVNAYMNRLLGDKDIASAYFRNELENGSFFLQITRQVFTKDSEGHLTLNSNALDKAVENWIRTNLPAEANTGDLRSVLYSDYINHNNVSFYDPKSEIGRDLRLKLIPVKIEPERDWRGMLGKEGIMVNVTGYLDDPDFSSMSITIRGSDNKSSIAYLTERSSGVSGSLSKRFEDQLSDHSQTEGYKGPILDSRQIALIAAYCTEEFNWHTRAITEAQRREDSK